ncbi:MAG: hypothetical protein WC785_02810 [Tatlockia sp.]|jgi:hypothetical protein
MAKNLQDRVPFMSQLKTDVKESINQIRATGQKPSKGGALPWPTPEEYLAEYEQEIPAIKARINALHDKQSDFMQLIADETPDLVDDAFGESIARQFTDAIGVESNRLEGIKLDQAVLQAKKNPDLEKKAIANLLDLAPKALHAAAKTNTWHALLIVQTLELAIKIPENARAYFGCVVDGQSNINKRIHDAFSQMQNSTPFVEESIALLGSRQYNLAIGREFAELVEKKPELKGYAEKIEQSAIQNLLNLIEQQINLKLKKQNPWPLGFFGSKHKIDFEGRKIEVPQGICELKKTLTEVKTNKKTPKQGLEAIHSLVSEKTWASADDSLWAGFKRLLFTLLGCGRSEETANEYYKIYHTIG